MSDKTRISTLDELKADSGPITQVVPLERDGEVVHRVVVRELSGQERFDVAENDEWLERSRWQFLLHLVATASIEPEMTVEDADALRPEWTSEIATVVMELSGMSDDDSVEEDIAKNSERASDDSGSSSPVTSVVPSEKRASG